MTRRIPLLLLCLLLLTSNVYAAPGDILFTDDFNNRNHVNQNQTTAVVDVINGEVLLPKVSAAGGMAARDNVIVVQNGNNVQVYQDSGSDYQYQSNYYAPNTLALAMRQQSVDHFRLDENGTGHYMSYTGSGYVSVPALVLSGLESMISITWLEDRLVGLDILQRQIRQFAIAENGWVELPSIQTDIENPIQVLAVGQSIAVLDEQGGINIYGFMDQIHASPVMALNRSNLAVIASDADDRILALGNTQAESINLSSQMTSVIVNEPSADLQDLTEISPGRFLIRDSSQIKEYAYTGSGNQWVPTGRKITATGKTSKYLSPRQYVSTNINLPYPLRGIQLVPTHIRPPGTSIDYYLSIDGGPWEPAESSIKRADEFQNVRIRANLTTSNGTSPRIQRVQILDRSMSIDDFIVTAMVRNPGNILPTSDAVTVIGGYRFDFEVVAPGADEVYVQFSDGSPELKLTAIGNDRFAGNYYFAYDTPIGSMFDVTIRAVELVGETQEILTLPNHFTIEDNIFESAMIFTIK
ncbi:hypothetical protein BHU72_14775 [Desulfuribacillus stibiiarsenatis]|uniref:F5/8 type C domain-containing protein n=1 Tax=Desulfuribacillus stibiiarsenatis TaxID=1390249 RepID=A0A1E5L7M7_9FIRM|nr:hypothetical protein [Desulfuribacillus stibiiarsenatis]OEH86014.1 hypothetical protein BHU72_14775 [Desulfuribacillus stibiiarsenatis]